MGQSNVSFSVDQSDYIEQLNILVSFAEATDTEVLQARAGEESLKARIDMIAGGASSTTTEVTNSRSGADNNVPGAPAANLAARLTAIVDWLLVRISERVAKSGLDAHLPAGGFRITGAADAAAASDYTTLQQVNALITAGGNPGDVPVTALSRGAAAAGEILIAGADNPAGFTVPDRHLLIGGATNPATVTPAVARFRYGG